MSSFRIGFYVNICLSASWSGPVSIEHKITTSWVANGKTYYRYSAVVTNKSAKNLKSLNLSISKLYGPIWGLPKSGDSYTFPSWISSLSAGKSLEFVYIHAVNSPADVSVVKYLLAWEWSSRFEVTWERFTYVLWKIVQPYKMCSARGCLNIPFQFWCQIFFSCVFCLSLG